MQSRFLHLFVFVSVLKISFFSFCFPPKLLHHINLFQYREYVSLVLPQLNFLTKGKNFWGRNVTFIVFIVLFLLFLYLFSYQNKQAKSQNVNKVCDTPTTLTSHMINVTNRKIYPIPCAQLRLYSATTTFMYSSICALLDT